MSTLDDDTVKRPASQYYWGDWFKDLALQSCSLPARGMWHEMNCLQHQGKPYGHLTMPNGKAMTAAQLANLCKISPALCKKLIQELEDAGVFSRTAEGVIFSRRMVRDEAIRNARAAGGAAGAEHGAKGAKDGVKGGRPQVPKGGSETPLTPSAKPPPSSSSSSATSPEEPPSGGVAAPPPPAAPAPTSAPAPSPAPAPRAPAPARAPRPPAPASAPPAEGEEKPTNATWEAYAREYEVVHGVAPIRNASVNGQLSQLVARVGKENAPQLAAWFVRTKHPIRLYADTHHKIGLLLRDCEGLLTRMLQEQRGVAQRLPQTDAPASARAQRIAGFAGAAAAGARNPPPARRQGDFTDVEHRDVLAHDDDCTR